MDVSSWIYDLKPDEFENLVATLLQYDHFGNIRFVGEPEYKGIDILAEQYAKPVGIKVKHRKKLLPSEVKQFISHLKESNNLPNNIIIATSAKITPLLNTVIKEAHSNYNIDLLGIDELQTIMERQGSITEKFFYRVKSREKTSKWKISFSILGSSISLIALLISFINPLDEHLDPLDKQMQTVESALKNIRDLETHLITLKEDIVAKEKATQEINEKYAKAKELEKITDAQLASLKNVLEKENLWKTFFGFILGISSSLVSGILYDKWKQRNDLNA